MIKKLNGKSFLLDFQLIW